MNLPRPTRTQESRQPPKEIQLTHYLNCCFRDRGRSVTLRWERVPRTHARNQGHTKMKNGKKTLDGDLSRRIRTAFYADQRFTDTELDLLHTPALQRLYDLHQLGLTDRVFVDASHSRLHHVIGVVEQADCMLEAIIADLEKHGSEILPYGKTGEKTYAKKEVAAIARSKKAAVRAMALLHDLPHAPYGHTLEDEIHLVQVKHDEPARQANAYYRLLLQYFGWIEHNEDATAWGASHSREPRTKSEHEEWLIWYLDAPDSRVPPESVEFIDFVAQRWKNLFQYRPRSMRKVSPEALEQFVRVLAFAMRALFYLDIAHKDEKKARAEHMPAAEYPADLLLKKILAALGRPLKPHEEFDPRRDVFLLDVIGNTVCADLLDYARRDAKAAGLKIDYDPARIIANMTVIPWFTPPFNIRDSEIEYPFSYRCLRTAISVFSHKLRTDVPGELINLLQARYFVYERMLFHPTKCVAGALLGSAIQFIAWRKMPEHLSYVGDAVFLHEVEEATKIARDLLADENETETYTRGKATQLQQKLITNSGTAVAARAILADRVLTVAGLREYLETRRHLPEHRENAVACLQALKSSREQAEVDGNLLMEAEGHLRDKPMAVALLRNALPTVQAIHDDLRTALRLLGRLRSRRYHRIIFRMLPDIQLTGLPDLTVEDVAAKFLDPHIRKMAEQEIEARVIPKLPPGSIVIHCPPAAGPTKLANILITDGNTDDEGCPTNAARLREIGSLNRKIFGEHEHSITALEKMYQSTWRLAVSVARPHEARWEQIGNVTGKVLFEVLSGGDVLSGKVPNDLYLERELRLHSLPRVAPADGTTQQEEESDGELARQVLEVVHASGRFEDLLDAQNTFNRDEFLARISLTSPDTGDDAESSKLFSNARAVDDFLSMYIEPSEVGKSDTAVYRKLKRDILALGPKGQRFTRKRISDLLPAERIAYNRPMLDKLVEIVAEARGYDAPDTE